MKVVDRAVSENHRQFMKGIIKDIDRTADMFLRKFTVVCAACVRCRYRKVLWHFSLKTKSLWNVKDCIMNALIHSHHIINS